MKLLGSREQKLLFLIFWETRNTKQTFREQKENFVGNKGTWPPPQVAFKANLMVEKCVYFESNILKSTAFLLQGLSGLTIISFLLLKI